MPVDLRAAMGWEFKKSLGTRDLAEAKRLHVLALAESDTLFEQVRARLAGEPLNGRDALILAGRWFEQGRAAMEGGVRPLFGDLPVHEITRDVVRQ